MEAARWRNWGSRRLGTTLDSGPHLSGERGMGSGAVGPRDCLGWMLKIWAERPAVAAVFKEKEREERLD
jgi:hypothetical protein